MPNRQVDNYIPLNLQGTRTGRFRAALDTEPLAAETDFATIERRLMSMAHTLEMDNVRINPDFLSRLGGGLDLSKEVPQMLAEGQSSPLSYPFESLSESAKQTVRAWFLDAYGVSATAIRDEFRTVLMHLGYPVNQIEYDYAQKDVCKNGMAAFGTVRDWQVCKLARRLMTPRQAWYIRKLMTGGANIELYITRFGWGGRSNDRERINVQLEFDSYKSKEGLIPSVRALLDDFKKKVECELKFICRMLSMRGSVMYADLCKPEHIDQAIIELCHEFHTNGERFVRRSQRHDSHAIYRGEMYSTITSQQFAAGAGGYFR